MRELKKFCRHRYGVLLRVEPNSLYLLIVNLLFGAQKAHASGGDDDGSSGGGVVVVMMIMLLLHLMMMTMMIHIDDSINEI